MKKLLTLAMALALILITLAGCKQEQQPASNGTPSPQETAAPGTPVRTTLRRVQTESVTMIDPHYNYRAADWDVTYLIFEPLIYMNVFGEFEPFVSTSYDVSPDGLVYTIHLREGIKFQSGGEMKASDVLFSIERAKESPSMLLSVEPIDKVEAPDDYTVVITLKYPNPMFPNLCYFGIMSEEAGKDLEPGFRDVNCGTGPYMVESFMGDEKVVLTRNEDWYHELPQIETIEFMVVVDATTALMSFEAGEIDYIGIPAGDWARIKESGLYNTMQLQAGHTSYLNMNQKKEPFDDVRVRQSFAYAINKEDVALAAREGLADVAYCMGNPFYITYLPGPDEIQTYPYNPEKARQLLAEAGYPNGLKLDEPMLMLPGSHFVPATEVIQQQLADIGVEVEIVMDDPATFWSNHISGNYLFGIQGFNWEVPDWYFTERIFSTSGIGDANAAYYSNPVVDDLYMQAKSEIDPAKRQQIFGDILKIVSEDAVIIPLYWRHNTAAWNKDLVVPDYRPIFEWYWTK